MAALLSGRGPHRSELLHRVMGGGHLAANMETNGISLAISESGLPNVLFAVWWAVFLVIESRSETVR